MIFEIDLNKEIISFMTSLSSFFMGFMFYYILNKCECGALWHTKEERNESIIYIIFIIMVSIIIGVFQYKLNFLGL